MTYITNEMKKRIDSGEEILVKEHMSVRLSEGTRWEGKGKYLLMTKGLWQWALAHNDDLGHLETLLKTATVTKGKANYRVIREYTIKKVNHETRQEEDYEMMELEYYD